MQNDAKKLIELATIDLFYVQLEVRCMDQQSEAMKRIAMHLDEVAARLGGLASILDSATVADSETDRKELRNA